MGGWQGGGEAGGRREDRRRRTRSMLDNEKYRYYFRKIESKMPIIYIEVIQL